MSGTNSKAKIGSYVRIEGKAKGFERLASSICVQLQAGCIDSETEAEASQRREIHPCYPKAGAPLSYHLQTPASEIGP
jgi:hypothetical protein